MPALRQWLPKVRFTALFCSPIPYTFQHYSWHWRTPDGSEVACRLPPPPPPAPAGPVSPLEFLTSWGPFTVQIRFLNGPRDLTLLYPGQPICLLHPQTPLSFRPPGSHRPGPPQ